MELRQLKYFLAVAESKSFVRAASQLYISRQAVSKSIAQLEDELQVSLFMRDPNGAYLTPAGIMFYERVRNSILELDQVQEEIRQYGTHFHQVIRVAFTIGTLQFFEKKVQQFTRSQGNISIQYMECSSQTCQAMLQEHKVDLAITSRPLQEDAFDVQTMFQSPYGVLLKNQEELATMPKLEISDLQWLPIGCFSDGQTEQLCSSLGLVPQYVGIDLLRLITLAAEGSCATLMPRGLLPKSIPDLIWLPLELEQQWQVYRIYLKSMENNTMFHSAVDTFLDALLS